MIPQAPLADENLTDDRVCQPPRHVLFGLQHRHRPLLGPQFLQQDREQAGVRVDHHPLADIVHGPGDEGLRLRGIEPQSPGEIDILQELHGRAVQPQRRQFRSSPGLLAFHGQRQHVSGEPDAQVVQPEFLQIEAHLLNGRERLAHGFAGHQAGDRALAQQDHGPVHVVDFRAQSQSGRVRVFEDRRARHRIQLDNLNPFLEIALRVPGQSRNFLEYLGQGWQRRHRFDIRDDATPHGLRADAFGLGPGLALRCSCEVGGEEFFELADEVGATDDFEAELLQALAVCWRHLGVVLENEVDRQGGASVDAHHAGDDNRVAVASGRDQQRLQPDLGGFLLQEQDDVRGLALDHVAGVQSHLGLVALLQPPPSRRQVLGDRVVGRGQQFLE